MPQTKVDTTDWQKNMKSQDCIKYLLHNESLSDVTFKVGKEGELIKAHKLILAMRSPVFEAMFYSSLLETSNPIVIPDIQPEAFRALLRHCYCDCTDIVQKTVLSTLYASKKFMLPMLEEHCREFQINNLAVTNIWAAYTWSITNADDKLLAACRRYFTKSVSAVKATFSCLNFPRIPRETLVDLLRMNITKTEGCSVKAYGILLADIQLFRACILWAGEECTRQGLELTGPNKRTVLGDVLFCFQFQEMLIADFVQTVVPTDVLTADEKASIFEHFCSVCKLETFKFPTTNTNFLLPLDCVPHVDGFIGVSHIVRRNFKYCSVQIKPMEQLILSGVFVKEGSLPKAELHTKHVEVLVINDCLEILRGREVVPQLGLKEGNSEHVIYLAFNEVCLDSNNEFIIQVESRKKPVDSYKLTHNLFSYEVKSKEDVNLEIVNNSMNGHILGLNVRLA